jgi:membrane-bound lytic murein transglycosylase A
MKLYTPILIIIFLTSCENHENIKFSNMPKTNLEKVDLSLLDKVDYAKAKDAFLNSCRTKQTQKIYKNLCQKAKKTTDFEKFIKQELDIFKIKDKDNNDIGLLTGYYEASLNGSILKTKKFKYPIYETPNDLVVIKLGSFYSKFKNHILRGRLINGAVVPYYTRKEINSKILDAKVICFTDSRIDLFFLGIQGSGRVKLQNEETINIGYANQNGHRYRSIGKYLINKNHISKKNISLQTIKRFLKYNPDKINEVLNYNKSKVFFKKTKTSASGSLGIELMTMSSIAVDKSFIPLGSMLYLESNIGNKSIKTIVMAQDTGGAIKGVIRADMFLGYGDEALELAGRLKSKLKLWIFMPKDKKDK